MTQWVKLSSFLKSYKLNKKLSILEMTLVGKPTDFFQITILNSSFMKLIALFDETLLW